MSKALKLHFADSGQVTSPQVSSTSLPADSQQVRTFQIGHFLREPLSRKADVFLERAKR